jgi:hypothetical protein
MAAIVARVGDTTLANEFDLNDIVIEQPSARVSPERGVNSPGARCGGGYSGRLSQGYDFRLIPLLDLEIYTGFGFTYKSQSH